MAANPIFKIMFIGVFVISIVFAFSYSKPLHYFPIKTVRIYGVHRVNSQELQKLVIPLVDRGFFTVNVEYIRERLLQMPWVSDIFVKRNWPDRIDVTLVEKKAVAYWNGNSLLSDKGELFTPQKASFPSHLSTFNGSPGNQMFMLKYFNDMNRLLVPLHAKISYLELTPYLTWKLILDNGLILQVGHKDILTRLDQFVKVYPKIVGNRAKEVDYIDLRYSSGMAVRWRQDVNIE